MRRFMLGTLLMTLAMLLFTVLSYAQTPVPAPAPASTLAAPQLAPAYLFAGAGYSPGDQDRSFVALGYGRKTRFFNGSTNFPTYSYTELIVRRASTVFTTGLVFPFWARTLLGFDIALGVGGTVGTENTPDTHGFTFGGKIIGDVSRKSWRHFGILVSSSPTKSTVGGVNFGRRAATVRYAFGGF